MNNNYKLYTKDELLTLVKNNLKDSEKDYDENWVETFLDKYLALKNEEDGVRNDPIGIGFHSENTRWVIRDDDINLLSHLATTSGIAALIVQVFRSSPLEGANIGIFSILIAAILTCKDIVTNGIKLTTRQSKLLAALTRFSNPVTANEFLINLNELESARKKPRYWKIEEIEKILNQLTRIPALNGELKAIVTSDENGRWWTIGV